MSWDDMEGSEKVRHCSKCRFNVYNFNEMTQSEIDELLSTGDRVCGRLFVRPDGTYMTKSCRKKSKRRKVLAAVAVIITVPLSILMIKGESLQDSVVVNKMRSVPVIGKVVNYYVPLKPQIMVGMVCPKTPPAPVPKQLEGDIIVDVEDDMEEGKIKCKSE